MFSYTQTSLLLYSHVLLFTCLKKNMFSCLIRVKERFKSKRAKNSTVVLDSHLSGTVRRPYLLQIHASNECWAASPTKAHVLVLLKQSFTLPLVLLFSCLKNHVLLFSCLIKNHVLPFSCLIKRHVLLFSCLKKNMFSCSYVLKNMFSCLKTFSVQP